MEKTTMKIREQSEEPVDRPAQEWIRDAAPPVQTRNGCITSYYRVRGGVLEHTFMEHKVLLYQLINEELGKK